MMLMITRAMRAATAAHEGVLDKGGAPYIDHPVRVSLAVKRAGGDDYEVAAALLHDTVEDTATTLDEVRYEFGERVADLVGAVSRPGEGTYMDWMWVLVASGDAGALRIKIADIEDNSSPARMLNTPPEFRGIVRRYETALAVLWPAYKGLTNQLAKEGKR